eukprot:5819005-Pleurochrysis_carterae.AAC.1
MKWRPSHLLTDRTVQGATAPWRLLPTSLDCWQLAAPTREAAATWVWELPSAVRRELEAGHWCGSDAVPARHVHLFGVA